MNDVTWDEICPANLDEDGLRPAEQVRGVGPPVARDGAQKSDRCPARNNTYILNAL